MKFALFRHSARGSCRALTQNGPRRGGYTIFYRCVVVFSVVLMLIVNEPVLLTAQTLTHPTPSPVPQTFPQSTPSNLNLSAGANPAPVLTPRNVHVNKTVPHVSPPSARLAFSDNPTDTELFAKTPFEEPLVPIGGPSIPAENQVLARALLSFSRREVRDDFSSIETFLATHPQSVWRIALLTDLGWAYRQTGWYSKAMDAWQQAWTQGAQTQSVGKGKPLIDRALAELIVLNARVGRLDQLKALIPLADARHMDGSSKQKVEDAKQAVVLMENRPGISFICGPLAVEKIQNMENGNKPAEFKSGSLQSTQKGTSLAQLRDDAQKLGLDMIPAKRAPGAPILYPAVINWKLGHFAAIVGKERAFYRIYDPTFSNDVWVSENAIDSESSGYFLVKNQALPGGWSPVTKEVADTVWGKGTNDGGNSNCTGGPTPNGGANGGGNDGGGQPGNPGEPNAPPPDPNGDALADGDPADDGDPGGDGGDPCGMAHYSVYEMLSSLAVRDTPLFYQPAYGPKVQFKIKYGQREVNQPSAFTYSNLGPLWTFNWLSYLTDDPSNPGANVTHYLSGGGALTYSGFSSSTQTFTPQEQTGCVLKLTSSTTYELDIPDGSKQFFTAATTTVPRKIFLTQTQDPSGNSLTFTYDSNFRLVSCTDAMGQVTSVNYGNSSDLYQITSVVDPFGRTATFTYTPQGYLQSSTDVSGITSSYNYTGQVMSSMTTPYGTTTFDAGQNDDERWVQVTDPMGGQERFETWNNYNYNTPASTATCPSGVNNSYLNLRNSFHWTKKEMQTGAGNYAACEITHWLHESNLSVMSDQVESKKKPLERRVYYNYPGQPYPYGVGTSGQTSRVTRILDDGSTQESDDAYNSINKMTSHSDPTGRVSTYSYASNSMDLTAIHQGTASSTGDLVASFTYNANHGVQSSTDASGQTTSFSYTPQGQIQSVTDPKGDVTSYNYYTSGSSQGYLQSIGGAQSSSLTYTWDGYGRVQSITDVNGSTISVNYDALNRVTEITYPDSTYEQRVYTNLSLTQTRDRQGRWTRYFYNANQQLIGILDSADRATSYDRCSCGELKGITDPLGHRTSWAQDIQGRLMTKTFFDNSAINYTYETTTSRVKTVTDAKGQVTTTTYNPDSSVNDIAYTNATIATPMVSYTYDSVYPRVSSMTDGTGTTNYTYNPVTTGVMGAGRLASETGPLGSTSTITYTYNQLGNQTATAINGVTSSIGYDSLNRVGSITNPLGTFNYNYVGITSRLQSVTSSSGPTTRYAYLPVNQDLRLAEIQNLSTSGTALSKFDYTYNPDGTIATWQQQQDSGTPTIWTYGYDGVDQLLSAVKTNTSTNAVISNYVYQYDLAGNRASEQIGMNVETTGFNSINQITGTSGAGSMQFTGNLSKPATVTVGGNPATVDSNNNFSGFANVTSGTNNVPIIARDYSGNTTTNTYQVVQPTDTASTIAYDAVGNMTNNGNGQTYEWDAKNELTAINYSGSAVQSGIYRTEFTYDGRMRRVKIVEKDSSGNVLTTKQHLWVSNSIAEERDASDAVQKRFYSQGEQIGSTSYFYTRDHLNSVRELVDASGTIRARYDYDVYGRSILIQGTNLADSQYAGYFEHQPSSLNLTKYRAYDPNSGRWINRDPIAEQGGLNLYSYCFNDPINATDRSGLDSGDGSTISNYTTTCVVSDDPGDSSPGGTGSSDSGDDGTTTVATLGFGSLVYYIYQGPSLSTFNGSGPGNGSAPSNDSSPANGSNPGSNDSGPGNGSGPSNDPSPSNDSGPGSSSDPGRSSNSQPGDSMPYGTDQAAFYTGWNPPPGWESVFGDDSDVFEAPPLPPPVPLTTPSCYMITSDDYLIPAGTTSFPIFFKVFQTTQDGVETAVPDGTPVNWTAQLNGSSDPSAISSPSSYTHNGIATVSLMPDTVAADVFIVSGSVYNSTTKAPTTPQPTGKLIVVAGDPANVNLTCTDTFNSGSPLVADGNRHIHFKAFVTDAYSNPVLDGTIVNFTLPPSDDGSQNVSSDFVKPDDADSSGQQSSQTPDNESTDLTSGGSASVVIRAPDNAENLVLQASCEDVPAQSLTMTVPNPTITANGGAINLTKDDKQPDTTQSVSVTTNASDGTPIEWSITNGKVLGTPDTNANTVTTTVSGGTSSVTISTEGGHYGPVEVIATLGQAGTTGAKITGNFNSTTLGAFLQNTILPADTTTSGIYDIQNADGTIQHVQYFAMSKVQVGTAPDQANSHHAVKVVIPQTVDPDSGLTFSNYVSLTDSSGNILSDPYKQIVYTGSDGTAFVYLRSNGYGFPKDSNGFPTRFAIPARLSVTEYESTDPLFQVSGPNQASESGNLLSVIGPTGTVSTFTKTRDLNTGFALTDLARETVVADAFYSATDPSQASQIYYGSYIVGCVLDTEHLYKIGTNLDHLYEGNGTFNSYEFLTSAGWVSLNFIPFDRIPGVAKAARFLLTTRTGLTITASTVAAGAYCIRRAAYADSHPKEGSPTTFNFRRSVGDPGLSQNDIVDAAIGSTAISEAVDTFVQVLERIVKDVPLVKNLLNSAQHTRVMSKLQKIGFATKVLPVFETLAKDDPVLAGKVLETFDHGLRSRSGRQLKAILTAMRPSDSLELVKNIAEVLSATKEVINPEALGKAMAGVSQEVADASGTKTQIYDIPLFLKNLTYFKDRPGIAKLVSRMGGQKSNVKALKGFAYELKCGAAIEKQVCTTDGKIFPIAFPGVGSGKSTIVKFGEGLKLTSYLDKDFFDKNASITATDAGEYTDYLSDIDLVFENEGIQYSVNCKLTSNALNSKPRNLIQYFLSKLYSRADESIVKAAPVAGENFKNFVLCSEMAVFKPPLDQRIEEVFGYTKDPALQSLLSSNINKLIITLNPFN